jgi:subtilisin family serine protease
MFNAGQRGFFSQSASTPTIARTETTGRSLILMRYGDEGLQAGIKALRDTAGLNTVRVQELHDGISMAALAPSEAMMLDSIGVAVVNGDPDQVGRLSIQATRSDSILAVEPERVVYAAMLPEFVGTSGRPALAGAPAAGMNPDYLRGYRDGFDHAASLGFAGGGDPSSAGRAAAVAAFNEALNTWGLQATRVIESSWNGSGIKVAVLDTGIEFTHPDFAGRAIVPQSFVQGELPQDTLGHGTHCVGTSMGPFRPGTLPRYGISYNADIYVGKVLNRLGRGGDGDILAGINWAVRNKCRVISMSLGAPVAPGQKPSTVFENMARRALASGTLIVAAAGNDSRRDLAPPVIAPVGHPANCPSIMAVAAVDSSFRIAPFSNSGIEPNGGQVDIAGPGVDVYSSWLMPQQYNVISGTSMATPHVAGIAALHAQANPGISAVDLWTRLVKTARPLGLSAADVGSGLVQAPVM